MRRGRYAPGLGRYKQGLDDPAATWVGNKSGGGGETQKEIHNLMPFI